MVRCIASVDEWMASNRLMLNPSKSEFIWFASQRCIHLIDRSPFVLPDGVVNVSSSVWNLGAFFDGGRMSMSDDVNRLFRSCFYHRRRIKFIRRSLTTTTTKMLVTSFIISRVDYCNSILAGIPRYQISRVQSILNVAARVIYGQARFDHITPTPRYRLHWLRVPERIQFKRCLLVLKGISTDPLLPTSPSTAPLFHQVGVYVHLCSSDFAFHALQDGHARRANHLCRWSESMEQPTGHNKGSRNCWVV